MKRKANPRARLLALSLLTLAGAAPALIAAEPGTVEETSEVEKATVSHDAKAVEIIERSIEVMGGRDRIAAIKYVHQTGTINIPMMGITGTVETYIKLPDQMLSVSNIPTLGEQRQGINGEVAWSSDAMNGPMLMPKEQADAMRKSFDLTNQLRFKEQYPVIEYMGEVDFDGQKAHKLRLVDTDETEQTQYFSVDSGFLIGSEAMTPSPMGDVLVTSYMREYKDLSGLWQPTKVVQKMGAMQFEIGITEASFEEFDDDIFELPEAVKALIESTKDDS